MKVLAVVLAAGRSERFGQDKLRLDLGGKPVWRWSFDALLQHPRIDGVGLVVATDHVQATLSGVPEAAFVVEGGATRQASTAAALAALPETAEWVLIHDGARPFLSAALIERLLDAAQESGASFPALAVSDTIKQHNGVHFRTLDRAELVAVQTPQVARVWDLRQALASASPEMTDDMVMLEAMGRTPQAVPGDPQNFKLTTPEDFQRAQAMLRPVETRTGFGYDIHRFSTDPARSLWLGGLLFPGVIGLEGHSDADVLLHAVVDALLGAANLGDIGLLYPNTDPRWKNQSSSLFVQETRELLKGENWVVSNLDMTVLAERPKIMVRRNEIIERVADLMQIEPQRVSIKATTHEGLGAIGRGEGIVAQAVATIQKFVLGGYDGSLSP
ncbi:MAG TPA: 2-C-methyl-D-erythritol 4-phosphate cytidylyltransferase [Fimbriimonadaceae bacterium]|nr:2-C-methyl-D-erythritol 4-phosphate cytidylyltransferase [Fimbriimonadaceae bacterium]HRJ33352.1 2-C-methyl-D-erythritol 4-phosphate cytidylyltransferase [Fimbriimonadaceae bacterium]